MIVQIQIIDTDGNVPWSCCLGYVKLVQSVGRIHKLISSEWAKFQRTMPDSDDQFIDWLCDNYPDTFVKYEFGEEVIQVWV